MKREDRNGPLFLIVILFSHTHYDKQDNYISRGLRAPAFFLFYRRFVHNTAKSVILKNFLPQIARFYLTLSLLGSIMRVQENAMTQNG